MTWVTRLGFVMVGVLHLLPLSGLASSARLAALYGVSVNERDLLLLLTHRAVLLGIVGAGLVAAAFHPPWRWAATFSAMISMASFLALGLRFAPLHPALVRVAKADAIGCAVLVLASVAGVLSGAMPWR